MKNIHLVYNHFLKHYILVDGKSVDSGRRTEIGRLEAEKLDEAIEPKRPSNLYLIGQIPEEDYKMLEKKYADSKVTLVRK